jgi:hypothetical protein
MKTPTGKREICDVGDCSAILENPKDDFWSELRDVHAVGKFSKLIKAQQVKYRYLWSVPVTA